MDKCLVNTRSQGLDKFYTVESVVDSCLKGIKWDDYDFVVEPSAGNGSFLKKNTS